MPKFEPKILQHQLDQNQIQPCYWIYGPETLKARELLKRIQKTLEIRSEGATVEVKKFSGSDVSLAEILDDGLNLSLFSHQKLVVVYDAHLLEDLVKNPQILENFLKSESAAELKTILVFFAKDLDSRKKSSKLLLEKAAVVECSEVRDYERQAWIRYLAKRRNLPLDESTVEQLRVLEPWTLSIIDHELEKLELCGEDISPEQILSGALHTADAQDFIQGFFNRDRARCLQALPALTSDRDSPLQYLGLLGWNLKQVLLVKCGSPAPKHLPPFVRSRLEGWSREWEEKSLVSLLKKLTEMDVALKQSRLSPLGLWAELIRF